MMLDGIKKLAPTGVMLMFAILNFGVMIDAGLFDPAVRTILKLVGGDPDEDRGRHLRSFRVRVAGCRRLDPYMITCATMLPPYSDWASAGWCWPA